MGLETLFKEYDSKPIKRKAYQIKPIDYIRYHGDNTYSVDEFKFKAHQDVEVGDWIVYLNEDDIYHCTDAVFRERNIVP
jgi:hypothetical protein